MPSKRIFWIPLLLLFFSACSGAPDTTVTLDGEMELQLELEEAAAVKFGSLDGSGVCLPCLLAFTTQATAIVQESEDSYQLTFTDFSATQTSGPEGDLTIGLNPEMTSEGVIYKPDENGVPAQAHHMTFHLRTRLGDQMVDLNNLTVSGLGRILGRDTQVVSQSLVTSDQRNGNLKAISLQKDIGTELVTVSDGCGGCPCAFASISKDLLCWEPPTTEGPQSPSFSINEGVCSLRTSDGIIEFQVNNGLNSLPSCQLSNQNEDCGSVPGSQVNLTGDQVMACQCLLEQYATDLNNQIQNVANSGGEIFGIQSPPFDCNR